eukprot:gene1475-12093_t
MSETKKLKVKIIEAKNLDRKDFDSKSALSDPYVLLSVAPNPNEKPNEQFHRTKVQQKTLNPKFNESFDLEFTTGKEVIVVQLFDFDLILDDTLGHVIIPLEKLFLLKGKSYDKWFYLLNANSDAKIKLSFTAYNFGEKDIKKPREQYDNELEKARIARIEQKKSRKDIPTILKEFEVSLLQIQKLKTEKSYEEALALSTKKIGELMEYYSTRQKEVMKVMENAMDYGIDIVKDPEINSRHKVEKVIITEIGKFHYELGMIYHKMGQEKLAIGVWEKAEKEFDSYESFEELNKMEEDITCFNYECKNKTRFHVPEKYKKVKFDSLLFARTAVLSSMFFSWVSYEDDVRYLSGRKFSEELGYKRLAGLGEWTISSVFKNEKGLISFFALFSVNVELGVVVLAFRGSELENFQKWETIKSWLTNFDIIKDKYKYSNGKVHRGFRDLYLSMSEEIAHQCNLYLNAGYTLLITGHSAGAAQATLCAMHLRSICQYKHKDQICVYTFGSPRVGDKSFVKDFNSKFPVPRYVTQIEHYTDIIPTVPPYEFGFEHCGIEHIVVGDKDNIGNPDSIPGVHYVLDSKFYKDHISVGCHFQQVYMDGLLNDQNLGRLYRKRKSSFFNDLFPSSPMSLSETELEDIIVEDVRRNASGSSSRSGSPVPNRKTSSPTPRKK